MQNNASNNERIAKNTFLLYARMIVIMIISLYTSRVVLKSLGVEDFGIYNVVTGLVIAFGFLNNAMTASVQRFLTVEYKKNDSLKLNAVFNLSILIHFILAVAMAIIAETIGIYYIQNKLVIPIERLDAAIWIFHFSVVSLFFTIMNVPYRSLIVTHEDMKAFTIISLFEAFAKLSAAFAVLYILYDKLIMYGLLLTIASILVQVFYMFFCHKKYQEEVRYKLHKDKTLLLDMCNFAGWNLIGVLAGIAHNQGINILLNIFGGPIINASRAIAYQVSGAANQLVSNFQLAVNPPIMKSFVAKDGKTERLVCTSSKISCILILFIAIPAIIETPYILKLWLNVVPDYAVSLTRLALIDVSICSIAGPLHTLFQATGKIRTYQMLISSILLLNLPLSYVLLRMGHSFEITIWVAIVLSLTALISRLILSKRFSSLTLKLYIQNVFIPILLSASITYIVPYILTRILNPSFERLFYVVLVSFFFLILTTWCIVLNKEEKNIAKSFISKIKRS